MEQWEAAGELSGKPNFTCENHAMPVFYRDVMYREGTEGKDEAYLKLYDGHDWRWFRVCLSHTDMEYLCRNWYGKKPVYLKAETECLDETDTPVRLPRYTQFTIKNMISNPPIKKYSIICRTSPCIPTLTIS